MQKYWLPFRKLETLDQQPLRPSGATGATERIKFRSNDKGVASTLRNDSKIVNDRSEAIRNERPQTSKFSKSENVNAQSSKGTELIVRDNRNNQNGFVTGSEYRKRAAEVEAEPPRKRILSDDGVKLLLTNERLLIGNVSQILKFKKDFPNVNAFYEVHANVYKIDSSCRARQKILLLRNKTGPILQAVFNEIDLEIDFVKKGDPVLCVGKFVNNRLNLFKVRVLVENYNKYTSRIFCLSNFSLNLANNSNKLTSNGK